jgi:spore coat polysaccharide biosynthesis protein SpsF (cytidylyltransferase family)
MERLCDDTVLGYVITRCQQSRRLDGVVVATSELAADDCIAEFAALRNIWVFRGSERDVLGRYVKAAETVGADVVVRITGDCPIVDAEIIDKVITLYEIRKPDYAFIDGYPNGLGAAEVLKFSTLKQIDGQIKSDESYYREHVVTYLLENTGEFNLVIERAEKDCYRPELRLCVDEVADLEVVRRICEHFYPRKDFGTHEVIHFLDMNPAVAAINKDVKQKTT